MASIKQTRLEAARMIADVLVDGSRIDRVLQSAEDGSYYTTTDCDYIRDDGTQFTAPHVRIPAGGNDGCDECQGKRECEGCDDNRLDWAFAMLAELDELVEGGGKGEPA